MTNSFTPIEIVRPNAVEFGCGTVGAAARFAERRAAAIGDFGSLQRAARRSADTVVQISIVPNVLVVNPDKITARTMQDLIAYLKANLDKVSFGSAGVGACALQGAASILDYTDEITRKTLPALGPALQPAASNVVKPAKR